MSSVSSTVSRALAAVVCVLLLGTSGAAVAAAGGPGVRPSPGPRPVDTPQRPAVPLERSFSMLCSGYAGCRDAGMSNAGYQANNDTMYWRMYSGHNCTNYVAYRMVRSGMPNTRPWSGGGNAEYWGTSNPDITDQTPAVGAVAWWKAYARPAGSAGHVAYVEKVVSPDEIIVSEDSWGGDFSWARITRDGGSWPSGFVHFNDVTLTNTAKPAVSGTPKVGAVLSSSTGAWRPASAANTYHYQWRAGGTPITGATAPTLRLREDQQGKRISVVVTASTTGLPATSAVSEKTPVIEPGVISSTVAPVVTGGVDGVPTVDAPLEASPGSWTPDPASLTYQWYADGVLLEGETRSTYTPGAAELGQAVSVTVTAARDGYDPVSASSPAGPPVQAATFAAGTEPALSGEPRLGETVTVDPGTWSPTVGDDVAITWLRDGAPIEGATGPSYVLAPEDLGTTLSARVETTRPGYQPLVRTTAPTERVLTVPTMALRTSRPGVGRWAVHVAMTAPGLETVPGRIRITSHGRTLALLTLDPTGRTATVLKGLPSGTTTFKVHFLVSYRAAPTTLAKTVEIK